MIINSEIKTILSCEEIALIAVALGNYQKYSYDAEMNKKAAKLANRLGEQLYSYPENDFAK